MKRTIKKDDWNTDDIGWAHKKAAIALTTALGWLQKYDKKTALSMIRKHRRFHTLEAQAGLKRTIARES